MSESNRNDIESELPFIKVVYYDQDSRKFVFDSESLERVLLDASIADEQVAVVSVAGAFRKGKSFLLNFFIRYLESKEPKADWIGGGEHPLEGFPWRGGSERETDGILLWRRPFPVTRSDGSRVVILLMDTQGSFDSSSTVKECATIFAISTMISSVQIYNITGNLQEDYLDHLQLFTEYGRIALEVAEARPFQDLIFLIRDWSYPYEYEYGYCSEFLDKKLALSEDQPEELQYVRKHIRDCFEDVKLFLLPHPGIKVATMPNFIGRISDIDDMFIQQLITLVTTVLSPDNLKPKRSQGNCITCSGLIAFFESYIKIFQSNILPEPKNILIATAEANHLLALNSSKQFYHETMNAACGPETRFMTNEELEEKHNEVSVKTFLHFTAFKKMGGDSITETFRSQLQNDITTMFEEFKVLNANKKVNSVKFVITATIVCLMSFFVSQILDLVGLDLLMLPFNVISIFLFITILFSFYAQLFGVYNSVMHDLNALSDVIIGLIQKILLDSLVSATAGNKQKVQ